MRMFMCTLVMKWEWGGGGEGGRGGGGGGGGDEVLSVCVFGYDNTLDPV